MADEHLPIKEKAKVAGVCCECGLLFYVDDWIVVIRKGDNMVAAHAEHYGVTGK